VTNTLLTTGFRGNLEVFFMAIDRERIIGAFAGAALTLGAMTGSALADYADITIRYGENVAEYMPRVVKTVERRGVSVNPVADLENPDCAAIVLDGEEKYRFSEDVVSSRKFAAIVGRIALGKSLGFGTDSDCLVETVSVDADHDITIRYGDNVEDMDMWVEIIEENGVKVQAINNLENPNCAAIVFNGEEVFRFSADSVDDATMSVTAVGLAQGETDHGFTESDCQHDITIRYGDKAGRNTKNKNPYRE
jgi:hypothetical protein